MRRVRLDDLESRMGPAATSLPLSDALGTTDAALNYYELEPGDSFAYGYHAHEEQEEIFYVESGTVTFRTASGHVRVGPGELVRFGPGEYQRGVNEGSERVAALAVGAPKDPGETDVRRYCENCEEETAQEIGLADDRDEVVATCTECGSETGRFD